MNNKLTTITLLALLIVMQSCREESVIPGEPVITTEPPSQIDYPIMTGRITATGDVELEDVLVEVYQEEILVGTVASESDGTYSTATIELKASSPITLAFTKEAYLPVYRRRTVANEEKLNLNVNLPSSNEVFINPQPLSNPGSAALITVNGAIVDEAGNPAGGNVILFFEETTNGFTTSAATFSPVDALGEYEVLVPLNTDIQIYVAAGICGTTLHSNDTPLAGNPGYFVEELGSFSVATQLPNYINPHGAGLGFTFAGTVLDCDSLAAWGTVFLTVKDAENYELNMSALIDNNGAYTFDYDWCLAPPYVISVYAVNELTNQASDTLTNTYTATGISIDGIDLITCNGGDPALSTATVTVGNEVYTFAGWSCRLEGGALIADEPSVNTATFVISDAQVGSIIIDDLQIYSFVTGESFTAVEGTTAGNISSMTTNTATVDFSGNFTNTAGNTVAATGMLDLKF